MFSVRGLESTDVRIRTDASGKDFGGQNVSWHGKAHPCLNPRSKWMKAINHLLTFTELKAPL